MVYLLLLALFYVLLPNLIHRREFDRAFVLWRKDPTQQNEVLLRVQQRKNVIVKLEISGVVALVLWTASLACYRIIRHVQVGASGLTAKR
jgi:hypothetical protein